MSTLSIRMQHFRPLISLCLPFFASRMQTVPITPSTIAANPTMFRTLAYTISSTGFRSLYAGLSASLMRQMSYSLVRIGSYESIKSHLTRGAPRVVISSLDSHLTAISFNVDINGPPPTSRLILSAAIAGGLGGLAGNPADILLVRMTTDSLRPPDRQRRYRNAMDGLVRLVREEGSGALAKGVGANVVGFSLSRLGSLCVALHAYSTNVCFFRLGRYSWA